MLESSGDACLHVLHFLIQHSYSCDICSSSTKLKLDDTRCSEQSPTMASIPAAFTINNYGPKLTGEVIELDDRPQKTVIVKTGKYNASVSPTPSYGNYVNGKQRNGTRYSIIVGISFFLSLTSLILVGAVILGFIQPMSNKDSRSCQCATSKTGTSGAMILEPDVQHGIQEDIDRIKKTLASQNEQIIRHNTDHKNLGNKLQKMNETLSTLQRYLPNQEQKKEIDKNISAVSKNMEIITQNITKLTHSQFRDEEKFKNMSATIKEKFGELKKLMWRNTSKLSNDIKQNHQTIEKFIKETTRDLLELKNTTKSLNTEVKDEIKKDLIKANEDTRNVSLNLQKLEADIKRQVAIAKNMTAYASEQVRREHEQNITYLSEKLNDVTSELLLLQNKTNSKIQANFNHVKQLLDPSKFRGVRGYNGSIGQPGIQGPPGPPGPAGFIQCKDGIKTTSGDKDDARITVKTVDTKTDLFLVVTCKSTSNVAFKATKKSSHGFEYKCTCDSDEKKPAKYTCIMTYLVCKRT